MEIAMYVLLTLTVLNIFQNLKKNMGFFQEYDH